MFSTVGDIISTVEGVQYRGEYHSLKFEYEDIMIHVGGYHEYRGVLK